MSDTVSNLPSHVHPTISRVFDAFASAVPRGDTFPAAAPNTFLDTKGNPGTLPSDEWSIHLRGNPGGQSMTCAVRPHNGPYHSIEGIADLDVLLSALSSTVGGVSTGTATLVASTVTVTVPPLADGDPAVPVGSTVYATVSTAAGKSKLLSAVRASDSTITISSTGSGYGALLESAGVEGALVAGTVDLALANVAGDRLSVVKTANGGTPGDVYTVERKSDTEVTVISWTKPTTASAALVAGTKDITLANLVGDRLSVLETAAGGDPADHFSVERKSATEVTVQAHDAAGALVATNTSTVKVVNGGPDVSLDTSTVKAYNFGQAAHETSTVRWAVIRPN